MSWLFPFAYPVSIDRGRILAFLNSVTLSLLLVFMVFDTLKPIVNLIYLICLVGLPLLITRHRDFVSRHKVLFISVAVFVLYHEVHLYLVMGELSKDYLKHLALLLYFSSLSLYGFCRITLYVSVLMGSLLAAGMAGVAYFPAGGRVGLGFNPNVLGLILAVLSALNLACFLQEESRLRYAFILTFLAVALAALTTGSRNVWLIELFLVAILVIRLLRMSTIGIKGVATLMGVGVLAALVTPGVAGKRMDSTLKEIQQITQGKLNTSLGYRIQMIDMGMELFQLRPVFGAGKDKSVQLELLQPMIDDKGYTRRAIKNFDHFHNGFIDELAKFGLMGFGSLAFLFLGIMRTAFQLRTALATGCLLGVYLIGAVGDSPLSNSRPEILLVFLVPLVLCLQKYRVLSAEPFRRRQE
ncbi:hypothetical protein GCM10009104_27920 [Marinobacterium maritimum]|uniref:O-antigen ligase-related domain-containing protein n=1 Tax=Marinobacterium maritimum TaxID=500162 RepID=A0ABP3TFJ7_9GAMM